jgi:HEAT repeats
MRKPVRIALVILLAVVLGGFAWQVLRPREPLYQGKPLSFWMDQMISADPGGNGFGIWQGGESDAAVRNLGTNAIPTLLRFLRAKDSNMTLSLLSFLQRQHFITIKHLPAGIRNIEGANGFQILGARAEPALPALTNIYREDISRMSSQCTLRAIGNIGPPAKAALPVLLEALSSSNGRARSLAIDALVSVHADASMVLPELLKSLSDPDAGVREAAARALGSFGGRATTAVPALTAMLQDPDGQVREQATNALKQIDREAAAKAGVK